MHNKFTYFNIMENAILFTQQSYISGYNTFGLYNHWINNINNNEYKHIDIYYGINIYLFKYNDNLYLFNIYDNKVETWQQLI